MASFTIDNVSYIEATQSQILQGSRDALIETVYVDGYSGATTYPTPTSWRAELQLSPGENLIEVYAVDVVGNIIPTQTITVTLPGQVLQPDTTFDPFDNFGLLLSLNRLPGEKNLYYRNRLADVMLHKSSSTKTGLENAISRELGAKPYYDSVSFAAGIDSYGELLDPTAAFEIGHTGIFYYADTMVREEVFQVDPAYMTITLTDRPRSTEDITVQTYNGQPIGVDYYNVDVDEKEIRFLNDDYGREWVRVRYNYVTYIQTYDLTISQLGDALNAFTADDGSPRIVMTILDTDVSDLSARNLENVPYMFLPATALLLTVYQMSIFELWDTLFKDLFTNQYGHLYNTRVEGWAREISKMASITWGQCILDRDHWDISGNRRLVDVLPHLWDPVGTRWFSVGETYSNRESMFYGGYTQNGYHQLARRGIPADGFKSGVGQGSDLYVADIIEVVE